MCVWAGGSGEVANQPQYGPIDNGLGKVLMRASGKIKLWYFHNLLELF